MKSVLVALEGHDVKFLSKIAKDLKGTSGEGWAIGEMVQRAIEEYGSTGVIGIKGAEPCSRT